MGKKMVAILAAVFTLALLGFASFFLNPFHAEMKKQTISVGNATFGVEVADTMTARSRGLSGRDSLDADKGMLFAFDAPGNYGFWMKDMKFPIDIVWINGDRVVGFSENLQPEPGKSVFSLSVYYPPSPADKVLEVNAGIVKSSELKAGDEVTFSDIP